jgi:hypothetical protein
MASAYRTDMQKSLDATGISLAKIMPASQVTLDKKGQQYFDANMGKHSLTNLVLTVDPDIASGALILSVKALYTPQIADVIGAGAFEIGTNTRVSWARTKLEVALAFDLSSSMATSSGGISKVDVAKEAAGELVDTLFDAVGSGDPERLKISVVPYTSTVNSAPKIRARRGLTKAVFQTRTGLPPAPVQWAATLPSRPAPRRALRFSIGSVNHGRAVSRRAQVRSA